MRSGTSATRNSLGECIGVALVGGGLVFWFWSWWTTHGRLGAQIAVFLGGLAGGQIWYRCVLALRRAHKNADGFEDAGREKARRWRLRALALIVSPLPALILTPFARPIAQPYVLGSAAGFLFGQSVTALAKFRGDERRRGAKRS